MSCGQDDWKQEAALVVAQILHSIQEAIGELFPCAGVMSFDTRDQPKIEFNDSGPFFVRIDRCAMKLLDEPAPLCQPTIGPCCPNPIPVTLSYSVAG